MTSSRARPDRPRVVVVGAGFGGLWTARTLAGRPVDVTLVDRNNYHTFFPLLYQVAAAELAPADIAYPVRSIFRGKPNVELRLAEVQAVDLDARVVETDSGELPYDYLVLALGSEPNFFGVEGAAEHAFPLRWMHDAIPLRHHVLACFEASLTASPERRMALLTFTIVGAGPTGVEFAGALSELIYGPLLRDFPGVGADDVRIELLEATDDVLPGMPPDLGAYARERLARRYVHVRTGTRVEAIEPHQVRLAGGRSNRTETVVWTAGVKGEPRVGEWGLPVGRSGRVPVTDHLCLADRPDVYVIGDLAYLEDEDGRPLPQVAQVAIQQGRRAGRNILLQAAGRAPERFVYRDPGVLAVIGRNAAVAHVFGGTFKGLPAWLLWLGIHIVWLIGFRNRALVLVNWAWNYVFFRRSIRLILPTLDVPPEE